jgi:hypothetical protein
MKVATRIIQISSKMKKGITEIEQLYSTRQKEWKISLVFWTLMSLLLVASVSRLFGNGLISEKTYSACSIHIASNTFMWVDKDSVNPILTARKGG